MKQRKAISPLVAVIMLIAFTLVVAGILAGWAQQFARTQERSLQYCIDAKFFIYSGNYAETDNNTGNLTLAVYNNGRVDLDFIVLMTYENGSISKHPDSYNITAGDIKTIVLDTNNDLSEVTIQSQKCPGAQDFLRSIDIKGLGY